MSKVIAHGIPGAGLGNKMFINALAYIISLETGRELVTTPIEFFKNTLVSTNVGQINNPLYTRQYGDHYLNLDNLYKHDGDIIINSFAQKQEYYTRYRNELKNFFWEVGETSLQHDQTVLYIRNGDYKDLNIYIGNENYYKMLDSIEFTNLTIVVEHVDDDVKDIADKYNANIFSTNLFEDFLYIKNAKNIIMSQSTFAWWAAFLGDPERVYIPLSVKGQSKGWWYNDPSINDVDLSLKYNNYKYILI